MTARTKKARRSGVNGAAVVQNTPERLMQRIQTKQAKVGVIGLGYVGLPLVRLFWSKGFPVLGFDIDQTKVKKLNAGESYILSVPGETAKQMRKSKRFEATDDFSRLKEADAIIICVPTPLTADGRPDLSYIQKTAQTIAKYLRRGQLISLESTTYPGTTREVMVPELAKNPQGLKPGVDYFVAFSPEREDPGNKNYTQETIPKVVGGFDAESGKLAAALYRGAVNEVVQVSSCEVAEAAKILENVYRCVNIALVNELKMLFDRMGIDVFEVIRAASTKPFGFQPFYPGPGWGGHCLSGDEFLFVRRKDGIEVLRFKELEEGVRWERRGDVEAAVLPGTEVLSYDLATKRFVFRPATHLFRRWYENRVTLRTAEGRSLTATDGHPMIVMNGHGLEVRRTDRVHEDCRLVVASDLPECDSPRCIDLVEALKLSGRSGIRVSPKTGRWADWWDIIRPVARFGKVEKKDLARSNALPLQTFLELERKGIQTFKRPDLMLVTGKGAAQTRVPFVIDIDERFARLVGYYLSERCLTRDKSRRTRWTFGADETELIEDVIGLLDEMGMRYSLHRVKRRKAVQIKVSSNLLGRLLKDALGCGSRSEEMKIPRVLMGAPESVRRSLLGGLLNGGGSVDVQTGERACTKRGRSCTHRSNAAWVRYFTSSPKLLQQAILLLHSMKVFPTVKRGKPEIRIYDEDSLRRLRPLLKGEKGGKLDAYLSGRSKRMPTRKTPAAEGVASVVPQLVERARGGWVYSVEVPGTETFVTSYGLVSHNCIPIDPFYLSWKAREYQFNTRFIELAGEINTQMPYYVVGRLDEALQKRGRPLRGAKVLMLGVAYKKDIDDPRESPAFRIMELLMEKGARVSYNDPFIPTLPKMRHFNVPKLSSVELTRETLAAHDAVLIVTDHSSYDWNYVVKHAKLVVDTRNATVNALGRDEKVVRC